MADLMDHQTFRVLVKAPELDVRVDAPPDISPEEERRVAELWNSPARPATAFDGELLIFDGIVDHQEIPLVKAYFSPYRFFWAQRRGLVLHRRLCPLSVSGVIILDIEGEQTVVLGRRSSIVEQYSGVWEFIPSGSIDRRAIKESGNIDYTGQLLLELEEEIGIGVNQIKAMKPLGLIHDLVDDVIDVCLALELEPGWNELHPALSLSPEYDEVLLAPAKEVQTMVADGMRLVPTSLGILDLLEL
ncbi:MAG: hypothetical protein HQK58_14025 [Deltaproteobacteria bacterium]|nr:hypothetical protein [Deltaproteobacteria bacterium]